MTDDCPYCGSWICLDCGRRGKAQMDRSVPRTCPRCESTNGTWHITRHKEAWLHRYHIELAQR